MIYKGNWDIDQATAGWQGISPLPTKTLSKIYSHTLWGLRNGLSFLDVERPEYTESGPVCPNGK